MTTEPLIELSQQHYLPGYLRGRKQPAFVFGIKPKESILHTLSSESNCIKLNNFFRDFHEFCGVQSISKEVLLQSWEGLVEQLGFAISSVFHYLKFPILDPSEVLFFPAPDALTKTPTQVIQAVPHCNPTLCLKATHLVIQVLTEALSKNNFYLNESELNHTFVEVKNSLNNSVSPLFLKAAYDHDIPVLTLVGITTQYGQGRYSKWLEHTFSAQTSNISVRMTRDKLKCSLRLSQAGLPVPPNTAIRTAEEAIRFGQHVGFPIVIKPSNLDGGKAVTANLTSPHEIKAAVQNAQKVSKSLMAEKHIQGRDYRLTVLDDKAIWAVERVPGGVFGDGTHTVQQLVNQENNTLNRRFGPAQTLKPLTLSGEAESLLRKQRLSPHDVPPQGQFVRLSSIANVATGGRPVPVFEHAHPDNLRLAEHAARALRLDIAGVDLLIPDISRSWREGGAAICEVNAQPDLGATTALHLYAEVMRARLVGNGRIPIVAVVGGTAANEFIQRFVDDMEASCRFGWVTASAVGIERECLQTGKFRSFNGGQILLTDERVEALIYQIHGDDILKTGLPADRIDLVLVAEPLSPIPLHREVEKTLLAACSGSVLNLNQDIIEQDAHGAVRKVMAMGQR